MIRRRLGRFAILALALSISSCEGDAGPTGPMGTAGAEGPEGPAGPQGPAGMPTAQALATAGSGGTLLRGTNIVSVTRNDVGRYQVEFAAGVDLDNGHFLVSTGITATCASASSIERSGTGLFIAITSRQDALTFIDCGFSLVVF